jgi:hypothetical protein
MYDVVLVFPFRRCGCHVSSVVTVGVPEQRMGLEQGEVSHATTAIYRPIRELAKDGDLVFAPVSPSHRFGRVVEVTTTPVTSRATQREREISIPAHLPAFRNVTDRGRCVVVQAPA